MQSGTWRIIVQSSQIAVQRSITLTVGVPQTVVTTVWVFSLPGVGRVAPLTNAGHPDCGHRDYNHSQGPK